MPDGGGRPLGDGAGDGSVVLAWLRRNRAAILLGLVALIELPGYGRHISACLARVEAATWLERASMLLGLRACG